MGGLRRYMPITYWTSLIGTLALVATPFFSGFYSKDMIIEAAKLVAHKRGGFIPTYAYWCVLAGAFVTSFYSFRLLYMTFHGRERFRDPAPAGQNNVGHEEADQLEAHGHDEHAHDAHGHDEHHGPHEPHESPLVVTIPLVLLAIPSILIGFFTIGPMLFGHFFDGAITILPSHPGMANLAHEFDEHGGALGMALHGLMAPPFWLALAGFAMATWFYLLDPRMPERIRGFTRGAIHVLERKYWADDLWIKGFAGGGLGFGKLAARFGDGAIIDGIFVDGSAWVVDRVASLARRLQSGYLYHYAFAMILGLIALLALLPKFGH